MLGFKAYKIISILYDVCGAGKYFEEVAMRIQLLVVEGARPKSVVSGGGKYRSTLIGCKCGIAPNFLIIYYYKKILVRTVYNTLSTLKDKCYTKRL